MTSLPTETTPADFTIDPTTPRYTHSRRTRMKHALGRGWAKSTGRESLLKVNKAVFYLSGRALGLYNYENLDVSGEGNVIKRHIAASGQPVVFDVGAHRGTWTELVLAHNPSARVHAFEPSPKHAGDLARDSRIAASNALVLGKTAGEITVFDDRDDLNSHHASVVPGLLEWTYAHTSAGYEAPMQTIDGYVSEHELDRVDFVKIDVEGFEYEVLEGARVLLDAGKTIFQFEFSEVNVRSRHFLADFDKLIGPQYELFRVLPDGGKMPLSEGATTHWQREQFSFQTVLALPRP
jgi:FkbM family methyltransferase